VNEKTVFTINGVEKRFPGQGIIDHTGEFRESTATELENKRLREELLAEALAASSPVSLRAHPMLDKKLVFIGNKGSCAILDGEYRPGAVAKIEPDELKARPFVPTGFINNLLVDQEKVTGCHVGNSGQFRLQKNGSDDVWNVQYKYGYTPNGKDGLNVDGRAFTF
jgi:hypothetical protein